MAGLVPAIHVFPSVTQDVDARHEAGHDGTGLDMHDIRFIRENPDAFDAGLARRGLPGEAKRLIALDEERRSAIQKLEAAQARRNAASKEIGEAKKNKDEAKAQSVMAEVAELKETIPKMEVAEKVASKALDNALAQIPNLPLPEVPDGKSADGQCRASPLRREARLLRFRLSSISISAKRLARWILRPPQNSLARALLF